MDFYWEIATLVDVLLLGHWLEMRAIRGATDALSELSQLLPDVATHMHDGATEHVPTSDLRIGNRVLVRPVERIPIDGDIDEEDSEIDESMITGGSRPVAKTPVTPTGVGALARVIVQRVLTRRRLLATGDGVVW